MRAHRAAHPPQLPPADADPLLSITEASHLGIASYSTLRSWIRNGRLPAMRYGSKIVRIRLSDLEALREPATSAPCADADLQAAVRQVVDAAPELSADQVRQLTTVLGGVVAA